MRGRRAVHIDLLERLPSPLREGVEIVGTMSVGRREVALIANRKDVPAGES